MLEETDADCKALVSSMGEKLTDKYTLQNFWETLKEIHDWWREADDNLKKIEAEKEKVRAKREAKAKKRRKKEALAEKMKRRPSKDVLQKKGVYKSRERANDEKKKREGYVSGVVVLGVLVVLMIFFVWKCMVCFFVDEHRIKEDILQNLIDKQINKEWSMARSHVNGARVARCV